MTDTAVSVRGLAKAYTIAHQGERAVTLAESLLARARRPFARAATETFWALRDVSFDIAKGDVVGIIGRNGAGKSTLLKVLSRITEPTAGRVDLYGRVGSLLEVGTGFHPELTGRENVYLNGAILGMTKAEIRRQFDAIVDFAGVEQFLDTPVKRYSSGMYVRLAFAVAAHLSSEILIIDEVLAVGDAEFQRKCMGKMRDVSGQAGKTVLFVSHNIAAVQHLCNKVLYLRDGRPQFYGPTADGVAAYLAATAGRGDGAAHAPGVLYDDRTPGDGFAVTRLQLLDPAGEPLPRVSTGDDFVLRLTIRAPRAEPQGSAFLAIAGPDGTRMSVLSTKPDRRFDLPLAAGEQAVDCVVRRLPLSAGQYSISLGLAVPNVEFLWQGDALAALDVEQRDVFGSGLAPVYGRYPLVVDHEWRSVPAADDHDAAGPALAAPAAMAGR